MSQLRLKATTDTLKMLQMRFLSTNSTSKTASTRVSQLPSQSKASDFTQSTEFYFDTVSSGPSVPLSGPYTNELIHKYQYLRSIAPINITSETNPSHQTTRSLPVSNSEAYTTRFSNINPCFRPDLLDMPIAPIKMSQDAINRVNPSNLNPTNHYINKVSKTTSNSFKKTGTTYGFNSNNGTLQRNGNGTTAMIKNNNSTTNAQLDSSLFEEYNVNYIMGGKKRIQNITGLYDEEVAIRFGL